MVQLSPPEIHSPPPACDVANQRLSTRVHRALVSTGQLPLRQVRVDAEDGRIALAGRLPSFYLKQLAQAAALSVPGVRSLDNQLVVG